MAATAVQAAETAPKSSRKPLILGLVLALVGGGAGFGAVYMGALDSVLGGTAPDEGGAHASGESHGGAPGAMAPAPVAFVPLPPLTINVGSGPTAQILRFGAQLEVPATRVAEVEHLVPRVMDVLNLYLRALEPQELQEQAAILRLRGQMLRRVQIVAGPGAVSDLLVSEFVMN